MRKILISPAHYLLDYTSRSEFYFAGKLIHDLALKTPDIEYYVLCGRSINEMPKNVKIIELQKKKDSSDSVELNLLSRIAFYVKLFFYSIRLSLSHRFEIIWHLFPNGRFSFNPFIFFQVDKLLNPSIKRMIGRLQYAKHDIHHHLDKFHLDRMHMHTIQPDRITSFLQKKLFKFLGLFSNYYFNIFDLLIFNNQSAKDHYLRYAISSFTRRSVIVPVAIDLKQFPFTQKSIDGKIELLYAGVLDKNKRVSEVIKICEILQQMKVNFHLSIVGNGELREELESLARSLLSEKNYTFYGNVQKSEMSEFYKKSHFLFSLSVSESFGQVFAESWSSGTVFIGSAIPVYVEVLRHLENGVIYDVENEDPQRIAKIIADMNQETYQKIANCAHEEVQKYDWSSVVGLYEQSLEQIRLSK